MKWLERRVHSTCTGITSISIPRFIHLFELSAVLDGDGAAGLATVGALGLDLLDNVLSLKDLAEDDVTAIEPGGLDGGDEDCCNIQGAHIQR